MTTEQLMRMITETIAKNSYPKGVAVMRQFGEILKEQGVEQEFLDIVEKCAECFWESKEIVNEESYLTENDVRRIARRQAKRLREVAQGRC